jgi:hypothetical protein
MKEDDGFVFLREYRCRKGKGLWGVDFICHGKLWGIHAADKETCYKDMEMVRKKQGEYGEYLKEKEKDNAENDRRRKIGTSK